MDRYSMTNLTDRYLRGPNKTALGHYPQHDQRRMSEPSVHGPVYNGHSAPAVNIAGSGRYQQLQHEFTPVHTSPRSYESYITSNLHRTLSSGDQSGSPWKEEEQPIALPSYTATGFEEPISPLNATFSGGEGSPGLTLAGVGAYPTYTDDYGPSPPGTGTSTSSSVLGNRSLADQKSHQHQHSGSSGSAGGTPNSKQYSFVALPGNAVRKRPRRRYDEIERLYQCSWPGCTKAYGTLNHLNAHVTMQKHGSKRSPNEFKELRKQWRKAKKEEAEARALRTAAAQDHFHISRGSFDLQSYDMHHQQQLQMGRIDRYGQHLAQNGDYHHDQADEYGLPTAREGMFVRRDHFGAFEPSYSSMPGQQLQYPSADPSNAVLNRLPPDSTLLTPLPGYESNPMANDGSDVYLGGSYELYSNDARPSSRHDSLNGYPVDRRHSLYSGDSRPRSGHADIRPRDGYGQI
ncbi:hypothetical protein CONPUDRAFT_107631 [Coniophora puteana RWD-64-598 SS2]|uniref:C2H2-type domain-containing protein n=1 Tax=Coniophora puteana (strain RWD-64-598) TaxID=741705 RepID=A0A5M3MJE4_CONPW|nr:uncharacterized protein CONPUDRAFT_107631 [Coniophora puteana RWD-64-598 SS2]EIW79332.1 hypothetical protein CONPUDRAFT_107631 [Coniophora puteana RWD-64-598 SS2]